MSRAEYMRQYRAMNRTRVLAAAKRYRTQNTDRIAQYKRQYQDNNSERLASYHQLYYEAHKDKIKEKRNQDYIQNWLLKNKDKIREYGKARKEYRQQYYLQRKSTSIKEYRKQNSGKIAAYKVQSAKKKKELREGQRTNLVGDRSQLSGLRESVEKEFSISIAEDWYRVPSTSWNHVLRKIFGFPIIDMPKFLRLSYPEQKWIQGRFSPAPTGTWKDVQATREFILFIKEMLNVQNDQEWYRVSRSQLQDVGAGGMLKYFGRLYNALSFAFPESYWDSDKFVRFGKKSQQRWLTSLLEQVYPSLVIVENFLHPALQWYGDLGVQFQRPMELDVWIPARRLGFEYDGEQHYHEHVELFGSNSLSLFAERDQKKKEACQREGLTLISIPYWWDKSKSSLECIIVEQSS